MTSNIQDALDQAYQWTDFEGVEIVGQGKEDGKDCIVVYVSRPSTDFADRIPKKFKGFPVIFRESDQINIQ